MGSRVHLLCAGHVLSLRPSNTPEVTFVSLVLTDKELKEMNPVANLEPVNGKAGAPKPSPPASEALLSYQALRGSPHSYSLEKLLERSLKVCSLELLITPITLWRIPTQRIAWSR